MANSTCQVTVPEDCRSNCSERPAMVKAVAVENQAAMAPERRRNNAERAAAASGRNRIQWTRDEKSGDIGKA